MRRTLWLILLFVVVLGTSVAGTLWYLRSKTPTASSEVFVALEAPAEAVSGDDVSYTITYKNGTQGPLTDVAIFFTYPEGAVPMERAEQRIASVPLGTLASGAEGTHTFRATLIGDRGSVAVAHAEVAWRTAGAAEFRKGAEARTRMPGMAFFLDFVVPQKAVSGERIVYFVNYANLAARAFPGTRIEVHYPDGFMFSGAEPPPTDGNAAWDLGEVPADGKGRITVSGILTGVEGDTKKVRADIGFLREGTFYAYKEGAFDTVVAPSPLAIFISAPENPSGVIQRGETVPVRITFKNNTELPIKDVVVRAELGGDMFSIKNLSTERGFYDSTRNTILWTPANVKDLLYLDPGVERTVNFRINIKEAFPIDDPSDANFVARVLATIESINVPPYLALNKISSSAPLELKVETKPLLTAKLSWRDDGLGIMNSGPIPPRANQETRYTVRWLVTAPANDLENVEVRATLPTGVVATGLAVSRYTDARPSFNDASGEVTWFIPRVPANTGVLYPAYETIFQISVTPSELQVGEIIDLVRPSTLTATDGFTGSALAAETNVLRTDSAVDIIAREDGRVLGPF